MNISTAPISFSCVLSESSHGLRWTQCYWRALGVPKTYLLDLGPRGTTGCAQQGREEYPFAPNWESSDASQLRLWNLRGRWQLEDHWICTRTSKQLEKQEPSLAVPSPRQELRLTFSALCVKLGECHPASSRLKSFKRRAACYKARSVLVTLRERACDRASSRKHVTGEGSREAPQGCHRDSFQSAIPRALDMGGDGTQLTPWTALFIK